MDKKMKNFDRNIEQMMNEHEVTPPFGMWNRISAELDAEVIAAPASVSSPIPQRTVIGFIAGVLVIGASLVTAYIIGNSSKEENMILGNTMIAQAPVVNHPVVSEPVVMVNPEMKFVLRSSKPKLIAKPVEEKTIAKEETPTASRVSAMETEVSVPNQVIAANNGVVEPYYFPAVDVNTAETKVSEKPTPVTKAIKTETKPDDNDRESVSNNDPPKIRFRPKKHSRFGYMKINRRK